MVTLDTTFTYVQSLLKKKLSIEELEDVLFDIGFELDEVEGDEIKVDITPERIDALSAEGLARIVNAYMGHKYVVPIIESSEYEVKKEESVSTVRPHTVCAVIKGLSLTDNKIQDIMRIQEKLHASLGKQRKKAAIGVYPLEKISWPITYCAKKARDIEFTPLDGKKMSAVEILATHETGQKYAHLLEGKKVYPLFIDSNDAVLSMPPIINSEDAGRVEISTKDVFIECSGFDLSLLEHILSIIICSFADMGGKVYSVKVNDWITSLESTQKILPVSDVHRILGIELSVDEIIILLEKMCHTAQKKSEDEILVHIPPFRNDQWHTIDLVDDVVRAYGINNIPQVVPPIATEGQKLEENRFIEEITQFFVGYGFQEVRTLGVTDKKDQFDKMNLEQKEFVSLGSTAERSINMLRKNILPELLKFLSSNQQATHPLRVFEIGDVIEPNESVDVKAENVVHLSLLECAQKVSFTQMKQLVESLGTIFSYDFSYEALSHPSYIEGRCAKILLDGKEIGVMGEINPQVLTNWNLDYPAVGVELVVSKLL